MLLIGSQILSPILFFFFFFSCPLFTKGLEKAIYLLCLLFLQLKVSGEPVLINKSKNQGRDIFLVYERGDIWFYFPGYPCFLSLDMTVRIVCLNVQTTDIWGFYNLLPSNISPPHCSMHIFPRTFLILTKKSVLTSDWNNKRSSSYKNCCLFSSVSNSISTDGKLITQYLSWCWPFILLIIFYFLASFAQLSYSLLLLHTQQKGMISVVDPFLLHIG